MSKASAQRDKSIPSLDSPGPRLALICRTDSLAALRAAVDHGADAIRLRWRNANSGMSGHAFQRVGLRKATEYAFANQSSVCLELGPEIESIAAALITRAIDAGINEVSTSSIGLALFLRTHHPDVGIRFTMNDPILSKRALTLLQVKLGIMQVTLPPVVSLVQLRELAEVPGVELEVQGWGPGCAILAGRQCDPGEPRRLDVDRGNNGACGSGDPACNDGHILEDTYPASMPSHMLATLMKTGVRGVIVETPGRSPARMAKLTGAWRDAIDGLGFQRDPALRLVTARHYG